MANLTGALAGWRRTRVTHGIVLTLQVAARVADAREQTMARIDVALNERQLRSFARDLVRAAQEHNIQLFASRPWWQRWFGRAERPIA